MHKFCFLHRIKFNFEKLKFDLIKIKYVSQLKLVIFLFKILSNKVVTMLMAIRIEAKFK